MKNFIPIYSEGDQIGGLTINPVGGTSGAMINDVGTVRLAAVSSNNLRFVLNLVPESDAYAVTDRSITRVLGREELLRKTAFDMASRISEQAEGKIEIKSVVDLASHIEKFLKSGR